MHTIIPATFLGPMFLAISRIVGSTYIAGFALLVIGVLAAKDDIVKARGLDKNVQEECVQKASRLAG